MTPRQRAERALDEVDVAARGRPAFLDAVEREVALAEAAQRRAALLGAAEEVERQGRLAAGLTAPGEVSRAAQGASAARADIVRLLRRLAGAGAPGE